MSARADTVREPPGRAGAADATLLLLGAPMLTRADARIALPFERRTQLLAFVTLRRAWVPRAELAALLWPDQERKLAYANLRKTLFRLQAAGWADGIEVEPSALRSALRCDVVDFEADIAGGRHDAALARYRGPLLAGFDDDASDAWVEWLRYERDRLASLWRSAALARLEQGVEAARAIELSGQLIAADPLDEAALQWHLTSLAKSGQVARARQIYKTFAERLADELGLDPSAQLEALHDRLVAATHDGAPVAPLPPPPAPTAAADQTFVGRAVERKRLAELLATDDCRLVSIWGPGGAGKTRLARRVLDDARARFADGAHFIALDDVTAASDIGPRLARAFGHEPARGADPLADTLRALHAAIALVVLDNFEQLHEDANIVARILDACPGIKVLVTSRIRLGLPGEWTVPLGGLPCPEPEDADRIEAFDAARLFVAAAQRVEPALLPSSEAEAIVDICRQVDGLPLALEMAAAWTRVLSCAAIAAELREGTELLRAVDRGRDERHGSFDVVFEQSWRLLSPAERDALARLSVLRGGFTAESARAVANASLALLGALVDKSLVRKDEGRMFLHPLVLHSAGLRLEGDARQSAERAHAAHFHRLLADSKRLLESGARDALRRLDVEFENCRIAWRWAASHAAGDVLAASALALLHYCDLRDRHEEGLALFREALAAAKGSAESPLRAAAGHLAYRLDRYDEAEADAERALAIARKSRDVATQALSLQVLGSCALRRGANREAGDFFREAFAKSVAANDLRKAGVMLHNRALVENALGDTGEALRLSSEALGYYQRTGDVAGEALCLNNVGLLYMTRKEYASAVAQLEAGLALCARHDFPATEGLIRGNLTEIAIKSGDRDAARRHAARALTIATAAGNRVLVAWLDMQYMRLALLDRDVAGARRHLASAMNVALTIDRPSLQLDGVRCLSDVLAAQGEPGAARALLAWVAGHEALAVPDRIDLDAQLAAWPEAEPAHDPARLGLDLRQLVQRIVVESELGYAPLVAALKGA